MKGVVMRRIRRGSALLVGALLGCAALVAAAPPAGAAPTAFVLYAPLNGAGECGLASIDLDNGDLSPIGPTVDGPICTVNDVTLAPDGTLYGVAFPDPQGANLVTIDTTTGAVTVVGAITTGPTFGGAGLAFNREGTLFLMAGLGDGVCNPATLPAGTSADACLYQLDPDAPGTPTFVGSLGIADDTLANSLAVACDGQMITSIVDFSAVVLAAQGPFELDPPPWRDGTRTLATFPSGSLASIDPATGALTTIGSFNVDNPPFGYTFDDNGDLFATGTRPFGLLAVGTTYSINRDTGAATLTGNTVLAGEDQVALGPSEIGSVTTCGPEPIAILVTPNFTG